MTTLGDLVSCQHPIEYYNQCAGQQVLQICARCGSYRWLGGPNPAWQRPVLVEEAIAKAVATVRLDQEAS